MSDDETREAGISGESDATRCACQLVALPADLRAHEDVEAAGETHTRWVCGGRSNRFSRPVAPATPPTQTPSGPSLQPKGS